MAKKKKKVVEETTQEITETKPLKPLTYKVDKFIFEPYFQRSEKMVQRYYSGLLKHNFYVMNEQIIDDNFIESVLVIDEFWIDISSIRDVKNEFIVIISDNKFLKKLNYNDRKDMIFLSDYKLLFSLPNTYNNEYLCLYVFRKIYKTIKN
jgi:hypothetical protein